MIQPTTKTRKPGMKPPACLQHARINPGRLRSFAIHLVWEISPLKKKNVETSEIWNMSACQLLAEYIAYRHSASVLSQDLRNSQILSKLLALVDPVPGAGGQRTFSSGFLVTMLGLG